MWGGVGVNCVCLFEMKGGVLSVKMLGGVGVNVFGDKGGGS